MVIIQEKLLAIVSGSFTALKHQETSYNVWEGHYNIKQKQSLDKHDVYWKQLAIKIPERRYSLQVFLYNARWYKTTSDNFLRQVLVIH